MDNKELSAIEKFFLPPCPISKLPKDLKKSGERPVLHLLRRDLEILYRKETESQPINDAHKAPYLATMGVLTGIDLMAKFYINNNLVYSQKRKGKSKYRFTEFLIKVCGLTKTKAKYLWGFRNALHHSYSLEIIGIGKNIYFTTAETSCSEWYTEDGNNYYIYFWNLKRFFLQIIEKYKSKIKKDEKLEKDFNKNYEEFGRIFVRSDIKSSIPITSDSSAAGTTQSSVP